MSKCLSRQYVGEVAQALRLLLLSRRLLVGTVALRVLVGDSGTKE